jgi:cysteine synthase A
MLNHNLSVAGVTSSALDLIGNTPLIALDRVYAGPGRILAKAEFMQPGGSVKDRAARAILLAARADGRLTPGAPVVEMTSGNMGAGLAVVCAALGHPTGPACRTFAPVAAVNGAQ